MANLVMMRIVNKKNKFLLVTLTHKCTRNISDMNGHVPARLQEKIYKITNHDCSSEIQKLCSSCR